MSPKLRVAMILDIWDPLVGGSQKHVRELASGLTERHSCSVDIFTRALVIDGKRHDKCERTENGSLRVIRVGSSTEPSNKYGRFLTVFSIALRVFTEHQKNSYDLVHAHSILGGLTGKISASLINRPVIFTVHGSPNLVRGVKNFDFHIEKFIHTKIRYDHLISVGKGFLAHKNVNRSTGVIPNGVNIAEFDCCKTVKERDFFKIIFVGRLDWPKGIESLIRAVVILLSDNKNSKNFQIHLIGYGFCEEEYIRLVKEYRLEHIVKFRGKMTGRELVKEYKSSHLFILPSICEGQPVTLLEAMAAGLPVLTTYAADNSGIITEETGWKVRENSPEKLAKAVSRTIETPSSVLEQMGLAGHKKVAAGFSWDLIVQKTFSIYKSVVKKQTADA